MYFDNELVESLLSKYKERGCTDPYLRDEIMSHASVLIKNIIRAHNFEYIFPGRDESTFNELFQTAWCQIEKTLYKYNGGPGSPKAFNLFSQIAKTRLLAFLKKEKRDKKNMPSYRDFINRKNKTKARSVEEFDNFLNELENVLEYDNDFVELINALRKIWLNDDKPYENLKSKLRDRSNKNMNVVNQFLKIIKFNRNEFSINTIEIYEEDAGEESYFYDEEN
jgi:hypothetical protein